jgi:hypothetical protein
MAGAITGLADDGAAAAFNPAGLATIPRAGELQFGLKTANTASLDNGDQIRNLAKGTTPASLALRLGGRVGLSYQFLELRSASISVAPLLREHLWDRLHAAVLTSATLSLDGDLSFTRARLGLAGASELVLVSPFDVEAQALLYIPRDAPDPRAAGWDQAIADHIVAIVRASEGRALCLFTSWRALEAARRLVADGLGAYPLLVQGDAPRERLLEAFRGDVQSVLLATQSFWQGVDVRGEACSCVIIDRLPFAVPSDPLVAGRCEQIVRDGGSAFDDYALPQAALMLRQGFGRLLRSHDDRGVVAVLDGLWPKAGLGTLRYLLTVPAGPALKAGMNALWMKLIRGAEKPDLIVADGEIYSTYESGLQENQRYADAKLGALGFETLKYKSAPLVFDGAATGITGAYFLNTKYMKFEIYSGRNFEALDLPDQSPDMDAVTRHMAFMGALTLSNRSMQGRLTATGT